MNEKTKKALDKVLHLFETGDVPEALSITLLPRLDVPSSRWSITNRLLMFVNESEDARGFRQWQLVGRHVKPKSKAFHIICPKTIRKEKEDGEKVVVVVGFKAMPVFRFEDTGGKALEIERFPPPQLPPLYEVARKWGISVDWQGYPGLSYGYFNQSKKEIVLATHDEEVFFHELGHAAHEKFVGDLIQVETWRRETVAELTAAVLGYVYGKRCNRGAHYRYIGDYAQKAGLDVYQACMAVVSDVGKCVEMIMEEEEGIIVF
ncbi:MAG: antirestriction protein [Candidatus Latescibacteria bacterium]|jgi:hypothetical protein|nr:antirestriction protein [Candidatus Latescibacterota bacterium]